MSSQVEAVEAASAEPSMLLGTDAWHKPLRQFSDATQMCVSAYDEHGYRQVGPFCQTPLGAMLTEAGHWQPGGHASLYEEQLFNRLRSEGRPAKIVLAGTVLVAAIPLMQGATFAGMVVYGWSMASFADPMACAKFARRFSLEELAFWQVARQLSPIGTERFRICSKLLRTLTSSIAYQVNAARTLEVNARAKDMFLATVSHELKTPLTAIMLRTQTLLRSKRMTDERDIKALKIIEKSAASQSQLIEDLLDASRAASGKMSMKFAPLDLPPFLRRCVDVVQAAAAAKNIVMEVQDKVEHCSVVADEGRLQQVFWNLLNNAIKFTPEHGHVSAKIFLQDGKVVISMTDTGRGIAPDFLPFVFETFAQAGLQVAKNENGLGLGLAISKYIVESHGGTIAAKSAGIGLGATFSVCLPRLENAEAEMVH